MKHKRETIKPSLFLETTVLTEETPAAEETDRTRAQKAVYSTKPHPM